MPISDLNRLFSCAYPRVTPPRTTGIFHDLKIFLLFLSCLRLRHVDGCRRQVGGTCQSDCFSGIETMKTVICTTLATLFLSFTGHVSSKAFAEPKRQTYYAYKLKDVIITSYDFQRKAAVDPSPAFTLGYTEVEWTFMLLLELGFTVDEAAWMADSYGN